MIGNVRPRTQPVSFRQHCEPDNGFTAWYSLEGLGDAKWFGARDRELNGSLDSNSTAKRQNLDLTLPLARFTNVCRTHIALSLFKDFLPQKNSGAFSYCRGCVGVLIRKELRRCVFLSVFSVRNRPRHRLRSRVRQKPPATADRSEDSHPHPIP